MVKSSFSLFSCFFRLLAIFFLLHKQAPISKVNSIVIYVGVKILLHLNNSKNNYNIFLDQTLAVSRVCMCFMSCDIR